MKMFWGSFLLKRETVGAYNVNVNQNYLVWIKQQNYYEVHRGVGLVESQYKIRK